MLCYFSDINFGCYHIVLFISVANLTYFYNHCFIFVASLSVADASEFHTLIVSDDHHSPNHIVDMSGDSRDPLFTAPSSCTDSDARTVPHSVGIPSNNKLYFIIIYCFAVVSIPNN